MSKDLKFSVLLDYYGSMLTDKQRSLMECYYYDDLSLSEIAVNEGITRQGVHDAVKRSEAELASMENKLGFMRMYGDVESDAEKITALCRDIRDVADKKGIYRELTDSIEQIISICGKYILND